MRARTAARLGVLALSLGAGTAVAQARPDLGAIAARGDAAWDARNHDAAFAAYDSVVRADSTASSRAVYRLGTLKSWRNQLREAIALHQLYVRLEPRDLEGKVGLGRVYAYASRFEASVATYDSVLAREADYRDAALGRAQALAWWGHLDESIAAYRAWIASHPADHEAELGLARALSWAGRLDDALAIYEQAAKGGDASRDAAKGMARVTGWRGDLDASERLWREITEQHRDDPEAWVGLAQVLRWLGRPFAARDALQRALAVKPDFDDARSQLRWVDAEINTSAAPVILRSTDSEHNTSTALTVTGDAPAGTHARAGVRLSRKANDAPSGAGSATAVRAVALWQPRDGRLSLRGEAGFASVALNGTTGFSPFVGGARVRAQVANRVTVGGGVARDAFDDVVSTMREQLMVTVADMDVAAALPGRAALAAFASSSRATGDTMSANTRTTAGGSARWTPKRGITLTVAGRTLAWDRPAYGVFFAPQRFTVIEASARWERPVDLGWIVGAEAALGRQSVRFEQDAATSRTTPRGSLTVGWRAAPGREVMLTALAANVASAATVRESEYSYRALTLSARFTR